MAEIHTLGHSTRSLEELIGLLEKHKIETLIDVRRFPTSKRYPHFNKDFLIHELSKSCINYIWLERLGGFRRGGYKKYLESEDFKKGIEELLDIAKKGRVAIMCAEILWFRCHRRYISNELVKLGHKVIHIIDEKRVYEHKIIKERAKS
ncbi:MAG: DUF488 domain-containing protein [archaeon]|nr:DUF488 domain-containing protein [archaeon]MCP8319877.1 DUF488 domain-containing protein [archaeon]